MVNRVKKKSKGDEYEYVSKQVHREPVNLSFFSFFHDDVRERKSPKFSRERER
ncbi:hypothetical protein Hdeb2414_s0505g00906771 [Helianthus debilis subsp. tardiflorus]